MTSPRPWRPVPAPSCGGRCRGDTDNTSFSIVGDELRANTPSALVAGDKAIRVQTTDAAGNSYIEQMTVTVSTNPTVTLSLV